jgi:hypothetical protein
MTKDEITAWALKQGWTMVAGMPSLLKPGRSEAVVRLVFKGTVAQVEAKKPAGKWEKIASESYAHIMADPVDGTPLGLGFEKIAGFSMLMRENKDRQVFAATPGKAAPRNPWG